MGLSLDFFLEERSLRYNLPFDTIANAITQGTYRMAQTVAAVEDGVSKPKLPSIQLLTQSLRELVRDWRTA